MSALLPFVLGARRVPRVRRVHTRRDGPRRARAHDRFAAWLAAGGLAAGAAAAVRRRERRQSGSPAARVRSS